MRFGRPPYWNWPLDRWNLLVAGLLLVALVVFIATGGAAPQSGRVALTITQPVPGATLDSAAPGAIAGRVAPGAMVRILDGDTLLGETQADEAGYFRFSLPVLAPGPHTLLTRVVAAGGNVVASSAPITVTVVGGPIAPASPTLAAPKLAAQGTVMGSAPAASPAATALTPTKAITVPLAAVTTPKMAGTPATAVTATVSAPVFVGLADGAQLAGDKPAQVAGTAAPGTKIQLYDSDKLIGETTTGPDGKWVLALPALAAGAHTLTARALGPDGKAQTSSAPIKVAVAAPQAAARLTSTATVTGTAAAIPAATGTITPTAAALLPQATSVITPAVTGPLPQATGAITPTAAALLPQATSLITPAGTGPLPKATGTIMPTAAAPLPQATGAITPTAAALLPQATATITPTAAAPMPQATGAITLAAAAPMPQATGAITPTAAALLSKATGTITPTPTSPLPKASGTVAVTSTTPVIGMTPGVTAPRPAPTLTSAPGKEGATVIAGAPIVLEGICTPKTVLHIYDGEVFLGEAVADAKGQWRLILSPLAPGQHTLTGRVYDAGGKLIASSAPLIVTVTPPAGVATPVPTAVNGAPGMGVAGAGTPATPQTPLVPVTAVQPPQITGPKPGVELASAAPGLLEGTAPPGSAVRIYDGEKALIEVVAGPDGIWGVVLPALSAGSHTFTVRSLSPSGAEQAPSASLAVTVKPAPAATSAVASAGPAAGRPVVSWPAAGATVRSGQPVFSGTAAPNSTVRVYDDGVLLGEPKADEQGHWYLVSPFVLATGKHTLRVVSVGPDGVEVAGEPFELTVAAGASGLKPPVFVPWAGKLPSRVGFLQGVAPPETMVSIFDGLARLATVRADASGRWRYVLPKWTHVGQHKYSVVAAADGTFVYRAEPITVSVRPHRR